MTAYIEWLACGPFYGGLWSEVSQEGFEGSVGETFAMNARAVGTTGTVTWQKTFTPASGSPSKVPPTYFWQQNGFTGDRSTWPAYWPAWGGAKVANADPRGLIFWGVTVASGVLELRAFDNGVQVPGVLFAEIESLSSGTYANVRWGVREPAPEALNLGPNSLVSSMRAPALSIGMALFASPLGGVSRWERPAVQLGLGAHSLLGTSRFGEPVQLRQFIQFSPDSLSSRAKLGVPSIEATVQPAALVRAAQLGAPSLVRVVLPRAAVLAATKLGVPAVQVQFVAKSLLGRARLGRASLGNYVMAESLKGGRLGRPSVGVTGVISVTDSLGPARWGAGVSLCASMLPLPLASRARLGRATLGWEKQCHC